MYFLNVQLLEGTTTQISGPFILISRISKTLKYVNVLIEIENKKYNSSKKISNDLNKF